MKTMSREHASGMGKEVVRVSDNAVLRMLLNGWRKTSRSVWKKAKSFSHKRSPGKSPQSVEMRTEGYFLAYKHRRGVRRHENRD